MFSTFFVFFEQEKWKSRNEDVFFVFLKTKTNLKNRNQIGPKIFLVYRNLLNIFFQNKTI